MMLHFTKSDSILRNEWITHQTTNSSRALQIPHMDGVNQLPALISQANEGARNAVHIHRDYDRDGHAYRRGPWKVGGLFFWCHFLVHRLLWVTIACLSFIHMCTMRQNLGEYHIKIDLSRRFFERYTKEGNFISGCSKFPGGLMRMEDWGQKFYSCCRFPIIYI